MSNAPIIGQNLDTKEPLHLDIKELLKTRLLVQANSGGGKSWAIRKILEETHGKVQQIVLDIEDDFSTLREKYDYILAGKGGDIAVDPRTAEIMARKVLELHADIIINLYELKQHERIRFVKHFLDAMVNSPKDLWHPVLIILDEAHHFAPEKSKAESLSAVIDMESRGRKRGFCLIPATQRLSKLHKDVAAECQNKLIGLANMDIDRKRASEEIGFTERSMVLSLRDLNAGEFYAVGPAFGRGVSKVRIGKVSTTHHEAGHIFKRQEKPVTTKRVQEILAKLTDLPREAEQELRDTQSMRKKIADLERQLKTIPVKTEVKIEKVVDQDAINRAVADARKHVLREVSESFQVYLAAIAIDQPKFTPMPGPQIARKPLTTSEMPNLGPKSIRGIQPPSKKDDHWQLRAYEAREKAMVNESKRTNWGRCERAILKFLAMREGNVFTKTQVGAMTQYSPGSGGFNNAISALHQDGLVARQGSGLTLAPGAAERAIHILGSEYAAPEADALIGWLSKLGKCERVLFEAIKGNPESSFTKDDLGAETGYSAGSGGFNNAISRLNTLGLIQRNHDGTIQLNQEIVGI